MIRQTADCHGITLVEIAIAIAVAALVLTMMMPAAMRMIDQLREDDAITRLEEIQSEIDDFHEDNFQFPDTLTEVYASIPLDPWSNPYQYLKIAGEISSGKERTYAAKPVNADYDLYSMGPDGASLPPLTAESSIDDIIRADSGEYVGRASNFK